MAMLSDVIGDLNVMHIRAYSMLYSRLLTLIQFITKTINSVAHTQTNTLTETLTPCLCTSRGLLWPYPRIHVILARTLQAYPFRTGPEVY